MTKPRRASRRARRHALEEVHALAVQPLVSVVMPTYETEARYLREAIESVLGQHYPAFELCIADDGSRSSDVAATIDSYRRRDSRVRAVFLERNSGISAATNAALELASGEYVAFLDHDDVLTPDALLTVVKSLSADPQIDVVYSDQDKLTLHGRRADPFFKPDWSPVYALGAMYIGHLLVARRSLVERVGGFDPAFDKIQDFELMLRLSEQTDRIHHIPEILYHWRAIPGSIAAGALEKSGVEALQANAVSAHLERVGSGAAAVPHHEIPHRTRLIAASGDGSGELREAPAISVVIRSRGSQRDLSRLVDSIVAAGEPLPAEVIVVCGPGHEPPLDDRLAIRVVRDEGAPTSDARAANLGAAEATGKQILFLAETLEVDDPDWLEQLGVHIRLPGVGAVGPLLVRPDGRAEAAGIAVGLRAPAVPMLAGTPGDGDGYYGAMACAREVSAASGKCLLVDADAFRGLGGFDELYRNEYADFDLCQRLRREGLSVIYAPRPGLIDHEPPSAALRRVDAVDRALFVDSWYEPLELGDPYFNPNFARGSANYEVRADYAKRG